MLGNTTDRNKRKIKTGVRCPNCTVLPRTSQGKVTDAYDMLKKQTVQSRIDQGNSAGLRAVKASFASRC